MLIHDCIPCQHGNHDKHRRVVQTVPKGMMGGQECHCEGECVERAARRPREPILPLPDDYTEVVEQLAADLDWRHCDRCVGNAEELRVVGPDHRNFSEGECPDCGHVTTVADLVDFDATLDEYERWAARRGGG